jgi:hypothetical protein
MDNLCSLFAVLLPNENEYPGFKTGWEILDQLRKHQLLKKGSDAWSQLRQ